MEKPDKEYAQEKLLVEGGCYATFGNYIFTDEIFEYVGRQIEEKDKMRDRSETDLTGAFMNAAASGKLVGALVDGKSFDVGIPEKYYETFMEYGR